jgi:hypothetical protein
MMRPAENFFFLLLRRAVSCDRNLFSVCSRMDSPVGCFSCIDIPDCIGIKNVRIINSYVHGTCQQFILRPEEGLPALGLKALFEVADTLQYDIVFS